MLILYGWEVSETVIHMYISMDVPVIARLVEVLIFFFFIVSCFVFPFLLF